MAMQLTEKQEQDGWQVVKFGEIAREVKESTKTALADGMEFYVGLEHLDSQSLSILRRGVIAADNPSFTRVFMPGQILFGKRRCYQKKAAVADFKGICSGDIIVMEAIVGEVVPELLPFFVQSDMFFEWAEKTSSGSLSPRTKWKALAELEIHLPPIGRQKKILEVLKKVDEVLRYTNQGLDVAKQLLVASLYGMFGDSAEMYKTTIAQLAEVKGGRQRAPKYDTGTNTTNYLRPANIKRGEIKWSDVLSMDFTLAEKKIYELRKGDILLVEGGEAEDVGDPAFFEGSIEPICFQNTLIRLRAKPDIDSRYLYWRLRAVHTAGTFRAIAAGTKIKHIGVANTSKVSFSFHKSKEHRTQVSNSLDYIQNVVKQLEIKNLQLSNLMKRVTAIVLKGA